ncbi:wax ester/triacylglycerol synthase family O-acyltransferase [Desulfobulbus sp. AH-315-M07]|nr:wax ester/triacylglycerol synthase family O-acyltransferase [Desulfobulbus sp. AH-315-M07]
MSRLNAIDAGFLLVETRETPMHVGGLSLFTLPEGADEQEYLQGALSIIKSAETFRRPFGHKLKMSPLGAAGPMSWVEDERLDLDYHVRHSALPKPGRYRELFALCSRLHQSLLDRHRPLWETYVIEGLQKRQFALYSKIHHCAIDGVGGIRLAQSMLSEDPDEPRDFSPFSLEAHELARAERRKASGDVSPPNDRDLRAVAEFLSAQFGVSKNLVKGLRRYARAWLKPEEDSLMTAWSRTPTTSFSTKISGGRRFVAQSYSLARVKAVARALGGTINDVVLAMCGGALRRYLMSRNELPDTPLTALTPVSLRTDDDDATANAVGALTANLATHVADPEKRFLLTRASMDDGKSLLKTMNAKEILLFSQLTAAPAMLIGMLGLNDRFPPFSTVISNVPGPRKRMYWNGARLDGMYPVSAIYHGFALNFTLVSNSDQLDFGVVACRFSVPSCQRIIDDIEASLVELEQVASISN